MALRLTTDGFYSFRYPCTLRSIHQLLNQSCMAWSQIEQQAMNARSQRFLKFLRKVGNTSKGDDSESLQSLMMIRTMASVLKPSTTTPLRWRNSCSSALDKSSRKGIARLNFRAAGRDRLPLLSVSRLFPSVEGMSFVFALLGGGSSVSRDGSGRGSSSTGTEATGLRFFVTRRSSSS